ncbi:hypothetical protein GCM10027519_08100 [Kineococcus endophyticus]
MATHADLLHLGLSRSTIVRWAQHGPWQRILPGVVLHHRAAPSTRERRLAAITFAGPSAVITGTHALALHDLLGTRLALDPTVLLLVPHSEQRTSADFVVVERTRRMPTARRRGGLPVASPVRAAADAARQAGVDLDQVREIFGAVLQQNRGTPEELRREVLTGPRQRTAAARQVLREVDGGSRSAAEGRAFVLIGRSDLPQPLWNEEVLVDGRWIGTGDAWWPDLGVVLEIDGLRWHSTPADIRRTQEKQRRYAAAGLLVLSVTPQDILRDPEAFLELVRATLERASRRVAAQGLPTGAL